jgi:hypothetical protein
MASVSEIFAYAYNSSFLSTLSAENEAREPTIKDVASAQQMSATAACFGGSACSS